MLGPNGEDGSLQGLAQLLHIPVVGSGLLGSAICMDKDISKRLLKEAGIPVADYVVHYQAEPVPQFAELTRRLGAELFIKPARLGSSVGIAKVGTSAELARGLEEAHRYDEKVLIERAIRGRELGCAVMGNDRHRVSAVSQLSLGGAAFFTYEAKYASTSTADFAIPAKLSPGIADEVRALATQAYAALECRGFARVDLFLVDDGSVLINEINTIPAFRRDSSFPRLWAASGLPADRFLDEAIALAVAARHRSISLTIDYLRR